MCPPSWTSLLGTEVQILDFLGLGAVSVEILIPGQSLIHFQMLVMEWVSMLLHRHLYRQIWLILDLQVKFRDNSFQILPATSCCPINNSPNNLKHKVSSMVSNQCNSSLALTTPSRCSSNINFNQYEEG